MPEPVIPPVPPPSDAPGPLTGPAALRAEQTVTVFRSRLRADAGDRYAETAEAMLGLARSMPGFVDFKSFVAEDGERVSIATFADAASQEAWRVQVDHQAAQRAGRDHFYAEYHVQVATVRTVSAFRSGG